MKKQISITRPEIKLVGLKVRTNNSIEMGDFMKGKIFPCVRRYFQEELFSKIQHRKNPGTTFCAYTDYESDYNGDYTYLIGEEVLSHHDIPDGFEKLIIPSQVYAKFTAGPGSMPTVLRDAWKEIHGLSVADFGGPRRYHTDFEIYDERAKDHDQIIFDIFIGVK